MSLRSRWRIGNFFADPVLSQSEFNRTLYLATSPETDCSTFDAFPNSFSIASMSANVRRTSSARAAFLWRKSGPSVRIRSKRGLSTSRSRGSQFRVVRRTQMPSLHAHRVTQLPLDLDVPLLPLRGN